MESIEVSIVDYGIGNLYSVLKACESVGLKPKITHDKSELINSDAIILPGVGAFGDAMKNLTDLNLVEVLQEYANSGKPLMGVCLGMQLLLNESEEFGTQKGLGVISGVCKRFPNEFNGKKIKVPQIMWNTIYPNGETNFKQGSPIESIKSNEYMYFVHSYYANGIQDENILCKTNYAGIEYVSGICKGNVWAFQFHPEKSGVEGLKIYNKFKELILRNK